MRSKFLKTLTYGLVIANVIFGISMLSANIAIAQSLHGISMHGDPGLPSNYKKFSFADSRTVIGGKLTRAEIGSFDSLNPFLVRGTAPEGLREFVFESLMVRHNDEPFALYGLLAESIETSEDRSAVTFTLRKEARFSDGKPVRIEDVIFSYETLKARGRPNHRYYYGQVTSVELPSPGKIKFVFNTDNPDRELPLIIGLMPILPEHVYKGMAFDDVSMKPPVASGPYIVEAIEPGRRITYRRNKNYWGVSLPFNNGRHNIERLEYEYFRDENSAFEAFKAGLIDLWRETDPKRWQTGYSFPAARDGRIIKKEIKTGIPSGLRGFVFNTRNKSFKDTQVRHALSMVFNFDWINKSLFSNAYQRTESYFQNSDLSAKEHPASSTELKYLRGARLPSNILQNGYVAPMGDEKGHNRQIRQTAINLLKKSGYIVENGRLINKRSGDALTFEILVQTREDERLALTYGRMLSSIGVTAKVRYVDATQYQNRLQSFDFDMIIYNWFASLSPGNEQAFYWGSEAADQNGSRNYAGIKSKQVDRTISALTKARNREDFTAAARALDRLLMGGHYVVPLYHLPRQWIASWSQVEHSWKHALYGAQIDSWWINPQN